MNISRMLALLAALPLAVAPAAALAAEAGADHVATTQTTDGGGARTASTETTTSQDSSSGATALDVAGLVTISQTDASTHEGGSANATALAIGGQTVVGGTQQGEGEDSGNLVSTGDNDQGHLHVAPWRTSVAGDRSASSRAALVDGNLGGEGGISLILLESRSEARPDGSSAESTGAYANLGGNEFRLLHARTASDGNGEAYLVDLAGERIGTSDDFDGRCAISVDPVVDLNCLRAAQIEDEALPEGADSGGSAMVGELEVLDGALTGDLFTGDATQGAAAAPAPGGDDDVAPAPAPGGGELPRTGGGWATMLLGALALGSGESLRRWKR